MSKTKFTIFFSWQSDIKGNTKIIRDSLKAECQWQKEKNGLDVKIDEATLGLPGSPKIEDAILDKIANSDIFVCDITPISTFRDKKIPNPNVLFELGFAFYALGDKRIIMLAKKGDWEDKDLPFDFNHRRIGKFDSEKDCTLRFEVDSCLKECIKHPKSKVLWEKIRVFLPSIDIDIKRKKYTKNVTANDSLVKATEESTVLFTRRIASAFPGVRGFVEITKKKEILQDLKVLLQQPLHFAIGLDKAETDPIWWFRGGSALDIQSFSVLSSEKVLLDFDELIIKRILIYRDSAKYYSQYVYVETMPDKATGLYKKPSKDILDDIMDWQGYINEEYADFKPTWYLPTRHISRQDYDDGATKIHGKHIELRQRAKLRCRYLTPYNFIICAKGSAYNCDTFAQTSEPLFRGMLNGSISNDQFNGYMMKFPKPSY